MSKAILFVVLFIAGLLNQVSAADAEQPTWGELNELFGLDIKSPVVTAFRNKYKLSISTKPQTLNPEDRSFSINYSQDKIESLHLRIAPHGFGEPNWASFAGELPYGLSKTDKKADIIEKLGKPLEIFGPGVYSDDWDYKEHRISVSFGGKDSHIEKIRFSLRPKKTK